VKNREPLNNPVLLALRLSDTKYSFRHRLDISKGGGTKKNAEMSDRWLDFGTGFN
jgi:hypothetical protein